MNILHTLQVPVAAGRVTEVLCSEAFNVALEMGRAGVVSTKFEVIESDERRQVFMLRTVEYGRNKLGGIDRGSTLGSTNRTVFDRRSGKLNWVYASDSGPARIKLSGEYRLSAGDGGTRVEHELSIEVDVPLIGGQIAKIVAKECKADFPRFDECLRKHLAE